ncbi:hypothetical protein [Sulfobacillus harzensis]|uniref:Uncharacterized protein n=1 Tax=Sulfobacillus harzensis TaxID=2729629 RepID=A0A7Y0Q086_9FIRM|nr:hypothetical protein [Sulfobacillus harzensis]NMP20748.1 hypothetical protein [Sulfobacillus harzensis]
MRELTSVTGLPIADGEAWNALVDRLHTVEPTRVWVPLTPTARAIVAGRTAQLRKILQGSDADAPGTPE